MDSILVFKQKNTATRSRGDEEMNTRRLVGTGAWVGGIVGFVLMGAIGFGHELGHAASTNIMTVDGQMVPDIGPLPTAIPQPATNLNYAAKISLGRQLYFDGRLSKNNAISCAFCHNPVAGFADPNQTSVGVVGKRGGRQAPTVYNTAFNPFQFWDGRAGSLEEQAIGPIHNPIEMAETHENVVKKLSQIKGYQDQFQATFGTGVSIQGIGEAIAAYERTVISTNSAFDKFVLGEPQPWTNLPRGVWQFLKAKGAALPAIMVQILPIIIFITPECRRSAQWKKI
ncbi:MAG: hypothetical protein E4H32_10350 [Nitrospirales bacterium]|nr:MAG: hypothetical protein E4H32_10350 [Nitrospirales bacterium]